MNPQLANDLIAAAVDYEAKCAICLDAYRTRIEARGGAYATETATAHDDAQRAENDALDALIEAAIDLGAAHGVTRGQHPHPLTHP